MSLHRTNPAVTASCRDSVAVCLAMIAAPLPMAGQAVPTLPLGRPTATPTVEFSEVTALHEFSPGRVLVADARERRLVILDLGTSRVQELGRIGSGPREFRSLGEQILARPGGAWVVDFVQRRLLPVNQDGTLEDAIAFPVTSLLIRASDSLGRAHAESMIYLAGRRLSDSVRIVRWDPRSGGVDTLLTYDAGRSGMVVRRGEAFAIYRPTTAWTVEPGGGWMGLNAARYELLRWEAGRWLAPRRFAWQPIPFTSADRAAYLAEQSRQPTRTIGQGGAPTGAAPPRPAFTFPEHFPVFEDDAPLWRTPTGELWIQRLTGVHNPQLRYDVIDPSRGVVAQVVLPPRTRVVGFGATQVYLAHEDADGLQTIRAFPRPALPSGR